MRVLLVGSSGGHLSQLIPIAEHLGGTRHWVTFDTVDARSKLAGEAVTWGYYPTTRNIPNLMRNWRQARGVLREFSPDLIVSTGAGIAVPYFVLGRRRGARTMYLEVIDRIRTRTMTGRLVYPYADDFLVQWPEQEPMYPNATDIGPVI